MKMFLVIKCIKCKEKQKHKKHSELSSMWVGRDNKGVSYYTQVKCFNIQEINLLINC